MVWSCGDSGGGGGSLSTPPPPRSTVLQPMESKDQEKKKGGPTQESSLFYSVFFLFFSTSKTVPDGTTLTRGAFAMLMPSVKLRLLPPLPEQMPEQKRRRGNMMMKRKMMKEVKMVERPCGYNSNGKDDDDNLGLSSW